MRKKIENKVIRIWLSIFCVALLGLSIGIHANAEETKTITEEIVYSEATLNKLIEQRRTEGYLYGGLFNDTSEQGIENSLEKADAVKKPVSGTSYIAKFVPENVLGIKAQVSSDLIKDDEGNIKTAPIRFVTAADSLSYMKIGFSVTRIGENNETIELVDSSVVTNYVYTVLYAVGATEATDETKLSYTPEQTFHADAHYFKTYTITNVPKDFFNTDLTVKPYWETYDGVKVWGTQEIRTVNLGRAWYYVDENSQATEELGTYTAPHKTIKGALTHETILTPRLIVKNQTNVSINMTESVSVDKAVTLATESNQTAVILERVADSKGTMFQVSEKGNLKLTGNLVLDGNGTTIADATQPLIINEGSLTIDKNVTLMNGIATNSKNSVNGGDYPAGAVESNGTFVLKGTVTGSNSQNGNAIAILGGNFTLDGGRITENVGRGVRVAGGSTMQITKGKITKNNGAGGGILLDDATLNMTGGSISQNTSEGTGAGVQVNNAAAIFNMSGGTISKNKANTNGAGVQIGNGKMKMTGGKIAWNIATYSGGAVRVGGNGASFELADGTIEWNNAGDAGGAIHMDKNGSITVSGGKIMNNSAGSTGGGINASTADGEATLTVTGGEISKNIAKTNGGGVNVTTATGGSVEFSMTGGRIYKNAAYVSGGGVNITKGTNGTATFTMKGGTIIKNAATQIGGGVNLDASVTFKMSGEATKISNNTSTNNGGGVSVNALATMELDGGTISKNKVSTGNGGGIAVLKDGATVVIKSGMISGNTAQRYGGGIYTNSQVTMENGTISGNTAKNYGGGIDVDGTATFTMTNGKITENTAQNYGGGVSLSNKAKFVMEEGTISENTTKVSSGGGVALMGAESKFTMNDGVIQANTAKKYQGGGVSLNAKNAEFVMNGGTICENKASGGYSGGGVVMLHGNASFKMTGGTITNNTATKNGGGIQIGYGTVTITGGTISENTASNAGGGVNVSSSSTFSNNGGTISNNTADSDADISQ